MLGACPLKQPKPCPFTGKYRLCQTTNTTTGKMDASSNRLRRDMFEPPEPESSSEPEDTEISETQPRSSQSAPEWCTCGKCGTMPTETENVCCREINAVQNRCGELPEEPQCLNLYSLQNALNTYQADNGPLEMMDRAVCAHYLAYGCFVSWCWGYLGKHNWVVIPSCVLHRINQEYPDEDGGYTGFKPPI